MTLRAGLLAIVAAACGSLLTISAQRWAADPPPVSAQREEVEVLATVAGHAITVADFESEMEHRGGAVIFQSPEARRELLMQMIEVEVFAANTREQGYLEEYELQRQLRLVAANRYRVEHIDASLAAIGVSDDEVADYYGAHRDEFEVPAAAHAALIYIARPPGASPARVEELRERIAMVRAEAAEQDPSKDFGRLAVRHSDDQASRYRGGDIGWVEREQRDSRFPAEVVDAISSLGQPGALSPVLETESGFYVIRLLGKKAASVRPLDKVATGIRYRLLREKREKLRGELYAAATDNVSIEIDEQRLAAIEVPYRAVGRREAPPPVPQS